MHFFKNDKSGTEKTIWEKSSSLPLWKKKKITGKKNVRWGICIFIWNNLKQWHHQNKFSYYFVCKFKLKVHVHIRKLHVHRIYKIIKHSVICYIHQSNILNNYQLFKKKLEFWKWKWVVRNTTFSNPLLNFIDEEDKQTSQWNLIVLFYRWMSQ